MRTIITNGKLILPDMMTEEQELVLEGGRIQAICPVGEADRTDAVLVDAAGAYIMPGLSTFTLI